MALSSDAEQRLASALAQLVDGQLAPCSGDSRWPVELVDAAASIRAASGLCPGLIPDQPDADHAVLLGVAEYLMVNEQAPATSEVVAMAGRRPRGAGERPDGRCGLPLSPGAARLDSALHEMADMASVLTPDEDGARAAWAGVLERTCRRVGQRMADACAAGQLDQVVCLCSPNYLKWALRSERHDVRVARTRTLGHVVCQIGHSLVAEPSGRAR